jgi:hypothetical protein
MAGSSPANAGSGEAETHPPGGEAAESEAVRERGGEAFYLLSVPRYWPGARTIVPRVLRGVSGARGRATAMESEAKATEGSEDVAGRPEEIGQL